MELGPELGSGELQRSSTTSQTIGVVRFVKTLCNKLFMCCGRQTNGSSQNYHSSLVTWIVSHHSHPIQPTPSAKIKNSITPWIYNGPSNKTRLAVPSPVEPPSVVQLEEGVCPLGLECQDQFFYLTDGSGNQLFRWQQGEGALGLFVVKSHKIVDADRWVTVADNESTSYKRKSRRMNNNYSH